MRLSGCVSWGCKLYKHQEKTKETASLICICIFDSSRWWVMSIYSVVRYAIFEHVQRRGRLYVPLITSSLKFANTSTSHILTYTAMVNVIGSLWRMYMHEVRYGEGMSVKWVSIGSSGMGRTLTLHCCTQKNGILFLFFRSEGGGGYMYVCVPSVSWRWLVGWLVAAAVVPDASHPTH